MTLMRGVSLLGACLFAISAAWSQPVRPAQCVEGQDAVLLKNTRLDLAIGKAKRGAIVSLIDRADGRELIAEQQAPMLFLLSLTEKGDTSGKRLYISNQNAGSVTYEVEDTRVRVLFEELDGKGINVTCSATVFEDDPLVYWELSATYPDTLVLEQVQYPVVCLRCPEPDDEATDALVMGRTKGGVFLQPSRWAEKTSTGANQPGSLTAQFACYYDDAAGVYSASYDSTGYPKSVNCRRASEGLVMTWIRQCFDESPFELGYDAVLSTFTSSDPNVPADWRDAADIYKLWAETQPWCAKTFADRTDVPEWLKSGPAMVRFGRSWLGRPETIKRWMTGYWARQFPEDIPLITAYWGWEKVGSWVTPDYFPVFPSDEQFQDVVEFNRQYDCHAFPWPSGYHYTLTYEKQEGDTFQWDDRERFAQVAEPHAVHLRDGSVYHQARSWLQGGETSAMCPGDPWTLDWMNEIARQLTLRGADMVQVDQVVGGAFPWCYSPAHPHPPGPGEWMTRVFRTQLETMLEQCRRIDPNAIVCFEEPNELFIQQVAVQDYRDWEVLRQNSPFVTPASVFNYIYHEYLPTFQSNPQAGNKLMAAYCLVNGQIPHMVPSQLVGPGPALNNGAFDEWSRDAPAGWDKVGGYQGAVWRGKCFQDTDETHGGEASLRLENTADDETVQVSQNVPVGGGFLVGHTYRLRVWIKSEGVVRDNSVMMATFADGMKSTGSARIAIPKDTGGEWIQGEATFPVPKESQLLRIMQHLDGPGTVWLDEMALEEVLPDGTAKLVMRPETPVDHALMRRWVELFAGEGRPYLLHGRMLHPPVLQVAQVERSGRRFPAILHNAYRAPDGSEAVVMVNITDDPQEGTLTWQGRTTTLSLDPWEIRLTPGD